MIKRIEHQEIGLSDDFTFDIQRCPLVHDYQQHTHNFSEFVVVLDGRAVHVIDDTEYPVHKGQAFLIVGDMSHGYKDVDGLIYYNLIFNPEQIPLLQELKTMSGFQALFFLEPYYRKEQNFNGKLELTQIQLAQTDSILNLMLDEYHARRTGYKAMIKVQLASLFVTLSRFYTMNSSKDMNKVLRIAEAVTYIEMNYLKEINLKQLSSLAYLSPRHFSRVFKHNYKISPIDYVNKLRLEYACLLLLQNSKTISDVAYDSGFTDHNYFSRQFKKVYGITPSDYKTNNIKKQK